VQQLHFAVNERQDGDVLCAQTIEHSERHLFKGACHFHGNLNMPHSMEEQGQWQIEQVVVFALR